METMTTTMTFETALGRCGVRWSHAGITSVLLPSPRLDMLPSGDVGDVPTFVRDAVAGMTAVLAGESRDLRDLPVESRHDRSIPASGLCRDP